MKILKIIRDASSLQIHTSLIHQNECNIFPKASNLRLLHDSNKVRFRIVLSLVKCQRCQTVPLQNTSYESEPSDEVKRLSFLCFELLLIIRFQFIFSQKFIIMFIYSLNVANFEFVFCH